MTRDGEFACWPNSLIKDSERHSKPMNLETSSLDSARFDLVALLHILLLILPGAIQGLEVASTKVYRNIRFRSRNSREYNLVRVTLLFRALVKFSSLVRLHFDCGYF